MYFWALPAAWLAVELAANSSITTPTIVVTRLTTLRILAYARSRINGEGFEGGTTIRTRIESTLCQSPVA